MRINSSYLTMKSASRQFLKCVYRRRVRVAKGVQLAILRDGWMFELRRQESGELMALMND